MAAAEEPLTKPPTLLRRPRPPKALTLKNTACSDHTNLQKSSCTPTPHTPTSHTTHTTHTQNTRTDFIIHPIHPRGPSFFPPGKKFALRHGPGPVYLSPLCDHEPTDNVCSLGDGSYDHIMNTVVEEEDFTLSDFQMASNDILQRRVLSQQEARILSRQNYLKLTSWFTMNVPTQGSLHTVNLDPDLISPQERKPCHQSLLELRCMVDEALLTTAPSTLSVSSLETGERGLVLAPSHQVISSSLSKFFCGQGRSSSPFLSSDQPEISPSEASILDCMMNGGQRLDLKARFLSQLPDLSPLVRTLTHLNLSFNCLNVFPVEVLELSQLVYLNMRNNPIKDLPNDIRSLTKLSVLCLSFNLLSDLPPGLFDLISLKNLNLSYNTLHSLSRNISLLVNLQKLNLDGNRLIGLPSTLMPVCLTHLLVGDNLMHPILWEENTRNQPQELVDLCCMMVSKCVSNISDSRLPQEAASLLQQLSGEKCDNCEGPVYGCGLRVIRSVTGSVLGVTELPFVFTVCSVSCRISLKQRSHWKQPFQ